MNVKIEWLIAAVMSGGLLAILLTGKIRLSLGPPSWIKVNRNDDPVRYWAFVIAIGFVIVVLIAQGMFG